MTSIPRLIISNAHRTLIAIVNFMAQYRCGYKTLKRTLPFSFRIMSRHGTPLTVDRASPFLIILPSTLEAKSTRPCIDTVSMKLSIPELALIALSSGKLKHALAMVSSVLKGTFVLIAV